MAEDTAPILDHIVDEASAPVAPERAQSAKSQTRAASAKSTTKAVIENSPKTASELTPIHDVTPPTEMPTSFTNIEKPRSASKSIRVASASKAPEPNEAFDDVKIADEEPQVSENEARLSMADRVTQSATTSARLVNETAAKFSLITMEAGNKLTESAFETFMSTRSQLARKFLVFVLCFLCTGAQLGFFDYYFIAYTGSQGWYGWIAADLVVLALLIWLLVIQSRYVLRCARTGDGEVDNKMEYAWLVWGVYAVVICTKMVVANYTFSKTLTAEPFFGLNSYRLMISASTVVFLLLVLSHHIGRLNAPRQVYLSFLATAITLDILDAVQFMDFLYLAIYPEPWTQAPAMQITVQFFACVNFLLPTFGLLKLRYENMPHLAFLPYEKIYTIAYFMLSNVPCLVIRIVLWTSGSLDYNVQIFFIKNVIGLMISIREIFLAYLLYRQYKGQKRKEERRTTALADVAAGNRWDSS